MVVLKVLAIFCLVYAAVLLFSGFAKIRFMIKLAKIKLGPDAPDKKALNLMYISGAALLVAGIVFAIIAF